MVGAANVPAVGALASLDHVQRQILETARGRVTQRGRRQSGGADDAVQPRQRAREALDDALGVALSADEDNGCKGQGGSHMNWAPMRHWKQADGAAHAD